MKHLIFILTLIILTYTPVFSQELVTEYQNLVETSQEYNRMSIRTVDSTDYLIEYSQSKLRVSIIDSSLVTEIYTRDDFPDSSSLVNLYKIYWNAKGEHIVDQGILFEFFTHEIRRRDLATGEIINSWSVDQDLTGISRAQVFGDYCFLWGLDNSFMYLNTETGDLGSIQLTDQDPIVVNGMIYFEENNKLLEVNPIDGSTTVLKSYFGPTFTSTYRGGVGEDILISNDFSENIEVFNGEEVIQYPWEEDVSFYITALYASEKYMAIIWDGSPELTLQVVDVETKTEIFREVYDAIDGHYAIDKKSLDNRHFIFQFQGFGSPQTLLFDSESGGIIDISDTAYGDVRFTKNMSFEKDSSLYLIGRETVEVFGANLLLEYELVRVNPSNLSSENISSSIAKGPFLVSPENTDRTLLISRDFSGHYLSVFNSVEDVKEIHKMVGYKNIGYEEIKYLAKWQDNLLLAANSELHLVGKDLLEIYEGEVHSANVKSGVANGLLFRDSIPFFFTLNMIDGSIELEELGLDNALGETSHIGTAIFGEFTKDHSLYFEPTLKSFVDIDLGAPIIDYYTSHNRALLQTKEGDDIHFYAFDGEEAVKVDQNFGGEVTVVTRSDGTFIIIENQDNSNLLSFIDIDGNIIDKLNVEGARLMEEDRYLINGPFSVLFFHENDVLKTVMSLYGRFQLSESGHILNSPNFGLRYSKGTEGILHQRKTNGQISYSRWNNDIIQLDVPMEESLIIAYFEKDDIRLVSSNGDEAKYNLLDKNNGELLLREELDYTFLDPILYNQNRKYRLNDGQQFLLSARQTWNDLNASSLVADFSDSESISISSLKDFADGPGLYRASDYIYTDNYIYSKALFNIERSEYQLYRTSTADNVTLTKEVEDNTSIELNVFPNITNEFIRTDVNLFDLRIINQKGEVIYLKDELKPLENLSIENLENGLYYLQGKTNIGLRISGKFIKV